MLDVWQIFFSPKAPGGVWQEGCLVKTCEDGTVKESLSDECVQLIEKQVNKLLEKKLSKKGGKQAVAEVVPSSCLV